VLSLEDSHHLASVLRLRPREHVVVSDGAGSWVLCEVADLGGGRGREPVRLAVVSRVEIEVRPSPLLTVAFALPKGDRPETIVRGLVEVGTDRLVPLVAERSVVRLDQRAAAERARRLRRISREAAMQSRRVYLPEVTEVIPLADFLAEEPAAALCTPDGIPPTLDLPALVVGPEGGFSEAELALSRARVGLGPQVLRSETAAVVAGALLVALRSGVVRAAAGAEGE
jgi:16S rRNA (uracil1498-N3)-methyltransferase